MFEPLSTEFRKDPYPIFERLRNEAPVYWHGQLKGFILSRYDDCLSALRDNEIYARDFRRISGDQSIKSVNIQSEDPPENSTFRKIIVSQLHKQDLDLISSEAVQYMCSLIEQNRQKPGFDYMYEIAAPVAMRLTCRFMGVDEIELNEYMPISRAITRLMDSGLDPTRIEAGREAGANLNKRMTEWMRSETSTGMIGTIMRHKVVPMQVKTKGVEYVKSTLSAIFNASYGATHALLGSFTQLLITKKEIHESLLACTNPSIAAQEVLRYLSPAQATTRWALNDVVLEGDHVIPAKTPVIILMASANRDETQFSNPNDVNPARTPNRHLALAWGPHACIGNRLISTFLTCVVQNALPIYKSLKLKGEPLYLDSATLRTLEYLPLTLSQNKASL